MPPGVISLLQLVRKEKTGIKHIATIMIVSVAIEDSSESFTLVDYKIQRIVLFTVKKKNC
jgi:hypothetical protein